jgi:phospholipid-binding lipoprotein MlaA
MLLWPGAHSMAFKRLVLMVLCVSGLLLAGCATGPRADPRDPLEPLNRTMWNFNEAVDKAVLKPVAQTYKDVMPSLVRRGVSNFFSNLTDFWSFVNSALQLRPTEAAESFMRFNLNTFFGLGGLLDIATEAGIERRREDFGKTLGRWGVPSGPYLVLPILGPSTLRDALVRPIDLNADPVRHLTQTTLRNSLLVTRIVDLRAGFLGAGTVLDEAALDRYSFARDVFLQVRQREVLGDKADKAEQDDEDLTKDAVPPAAAVPAAQPASPPTSPSK